MLPVPRWCELSMVPVRRSSFMSTDTSIKVISSRYCCRCQGDLILVLLPVTRRSILSTPEVICSQYWHQYEDDMLSVLIPLSRWSVLRTGNGTKMIGSFFLFTMPSISLFRERDTGNGTDMRTRHGRSVQVPGFDRATREMRSIPVLILKSTSVKHRSVLASDYDRNHRSSVAARVSRSLPLMTRYSRKRTLNFLQYLFLT